jgi:hypothetical protein
MPDRASANASLLREDKEHAVLPCVRLFCTLEAHEAVHSSSLSAIAFLLPVTDAHQS